MHLKVLHLRDALHAIADTVCETDVGMCVDILLNVLFHYSRQQTDIPMI